MPFSWTQLWKDFKLWMMVTSVKPYVVLLVVVTWVRLQGNVFRNMHDMWDQMTYLLWLTYLLFLGIWCIFKRDTWWPFELVKMHTSGLRWIPAVLFAGTSHARSAGITAQRFQCFVPEHSWSGGLCCMSTLWPPLQGPPLSWLPAGHEEKAQRWSIW